jgi:hypothetical protein
MWISVFTLCLLCVGIADMMMREGDDLVALGRRGVHCDALGTVADLNCSNQDLV